MVDKKKIFELYRDAPLLMRAYLRIKLKINPLIRLEEFVPRTGDVVDLGCGSGLFPNILRLGSPERQILGFDLDEKKIDLAIKTKSQDTPITFRIGDVVELEYPQGDVFTLIDILYLIPFDKQVQILKKCYQSLSKGGTLVIKDMDNRPRWKYAFNLFQETLAVKVIGFTLGERFFFRNQKDYLETIREIGFSVESISLHDGYWYPHIAYVCTK